MTKLIFRLKSFLSKAAGDSRTPGCFARFYSVLSRDSVTECASPLALGYAGMEKRPIFFGSLTREFALAFAAFFVAASFAFSAGAADAPANLQGPFQHPGILVNRAQLDFVKAKIAAGAEPWKAAFEAGKSSAQGSLTYTPHPWTNCQCGPRSNPDLGCKDEQHDSEAAYAQALLWYFSGDTRYAENAIKIMNAWSSTLVGGHTLANGPVQAAWCGEVWPRAAEIMRYTYPGWSKDDAAKFGKMLTTQYIPSLIGGSCENGNKELSMSEALINIGVYNDDHATFDAGVKYVARSRTGVYLFEIGRRVSGQTGQLRRDGDLGEQGNQAGVCRRFVAGDVSRFGALRAGVVGDGQCRRDRAPAGTRSLFRAGRPHHGGDGISGAIPAAEQRAAAAAFGIQQTSDVGNRLQPFP